MLTTQNACQSQICFGDCFDFFEMDDFDCFCLEWLPGWVQVQEEHERKLAAIALPADEGMLQRSHDSAVLRALARFDAEKFGNMGQSGAGPLRESLSILLAKQLECVPLPLTLILSDMEVPQCWSRCDLLVSLMLLTSKSAASRGVYHALPQLFMPLL